MDHFFENLQKRQLKDPYQLLDLSRHPDLRLSDVPGGMEAIEHLMVFPEDQHVATFLETMIGEQQEKAQECLDPFLASYPELGSLENQLQEISLFMMPTGDVMKLPLRDIAKGMLIIGAPGAGKTSLLRFLFLQILILDSC